MPTAQNLHSVKLNLRAPSVAELSGAFQAMSEQRLRSPLYSEIEDRSAEAITLLISRPGFVLEYDGVSVLGSLYLRLLQPFLLPPRAAQQLRVVITPTSLHMWALCTQARAMTLAEAKSLSKKNLSRLPPGIHNPSALFIVKGVQPREVQGGLPSLGRKK